MVGKLRLEKEGIISFKKVGVEDYFQLTVEDLNCTAKALLNTTKKNS